MKIKNFAFAFLCILFLAQCGKDDPCSDIDCGTNGVCIEGTCNCDPGFSGVQCEIEDKCFNSNCVNGECDPDTGDCICNEGFTGDDCEKLIFSKITRYRDGELSRVYFFNESFRVAKIEYYNSGELSDSQDYVYDSPTKYSILYSDEMGNQTRSLEVVLEEDTGNTIGTSYDLDNQITSSSEFFWTDCGVETSIFFDAEGQTTRYSETTYNGDNCSSERLTYENDLLIYKDTYTYDDKKKLPISTSGWLKDFWLENQGNLLRWERIIYDEYGDESFSYDFTYDYTFNADGYPESYTSTSSSTGSQNEYVYVYE